MRTAIIIPTYNERENLRLLVERIAALRLPDTEVLIVDDNSPDGTGEVAEEMARAAASFSSPSERGTNRKRGDLKVAATTGEESLRIRILHRTRKEGLGTALTAGFHDALMHSAEIIVQMDADGSHDPTEIPTMIHRIAQSADLVVGSRRVPGGHIIGWSAHRRLASWGAQWIGRRLLGFRTRDITSGFRAWRASALRAALAAIET